MTCTERQWSWFSPLCCGSFGPMTKVNVLTWFGSSMSLLVCSRSSSYPAPFLWIRPMTLLRTKLQTRTLPAGSQSTNFVQHLNSITASTPVRNDRHQGRTQSLIHSNWTRRAWKHPCRQQRSSSTGAMSPSYNIILKTPSLIYHFGFSLRASEGVCVCVCVYLEGAHLVFSSNKPMKRLKGTLARLPCYTRIKKVVSEMPCQPFPPSINPLSPVPAETRGGRMGRKRQTRCDSYTFNEFPDHY